ncbi:hypothetical protein [Streptomyces thermolilacinus]|uniref:hypothetical protein n=1 Tax=Streptomyces thermolilacinus TaxID=285540 RepID=UPI0033D43681
MTSRLRMLFEPVVLCVCMVIGVAIIWTAQWFNEYPAYKHWHWFNLFGLADKRWSIGRRELVHLAGFIGCILSSWGLIESFKFKYLRVIQGCLAVMALLWAAAHWLEPAFIAYSFHQFWGDKMSVAQATYGFTVMCLMCLEKWGGTRISALVALQSVTAFAVFISLGWELFCQPLLGLNRTPETTGLDAAQILCDMISISLGFAVTYGVLKMLESEQLPTAIRAQ